MTAASELSFTLIGGIIFEEKGAPPTTASPFFEFKATPSTSAAAVSAMLTRTFADTLREPAALPGFMLSMTLPPNLCSKICNNALLFIIIPQKFKIYNYFISTIVIFSAGTAISPKSVLFICAACAVSSPAVLTITFAVEFVR